MEPSWTAQVVAWSDKVGATLQTFFSQSKFLSEPALSWLLSSQLPEPAALFVGNSMPIRDMDMFATSAGRAVRVFANRGASGIDGNIATAVGIARGLGAPPQFVVAHIGDLACLHDLNSLALVSKSRAPVILIVTNNDGGGVFHFLPVAELRDLFEPYFASPHGFRFDRAAEMFGLRYARPASKDEFSDTCRAALSAGESMLIEVVTDRVENFRVHQALYAHILAALSAH